MTRVMPVLLSLLIVSGMAACLVWAEGTTQDSPYAAWAHGPSPDPGFFPLAVWLQDPEQAETHQALGINTYVGLWNGPTEQQLQRLRQAGMQAVCDQNEIGLEHRDDPIILAWMHGDEPDNSQELPGRGYGPAIPTARVIADWSLGTLYDSQPPVKPV